MSCSSSDAEQQGQGGWRGGGANLIWTEVPVGRVRRPLLLLWTKTLRLVVIGRTARGSAVCDIKAR